MGGKRSSDVSNDSSKVPNKEERKEITGTDTGGGQFAKDVFIKGIFPGVYIPVSAPEKKPVNTKELGQLVDEDVIEVLSDQRTRLTDAQKALLFDKIPSTLVTLLPGESWAFRLKGIFEVHRIKVVDVNTIYVPNLRISVFYPNNTYTQHLTQPVTVDDEIRAFMITNLTQNPVDISEVFVETIQNVKVTGSVTVVQPTEATPWNSKELKQLVNEDVPIATIEYAPLVMTISAPVTGTHYDPEEAFDITYTSTGGKPARTCGLRISSNPIPDNAAYLLATPIQAEGGADAGTVPTTAPLAPGTYYIRGRVTDAQPLTALSNQVTIIVDAPVQRVVWFLAGESSA